MASQVINTCVRLPAIEAELGSDRQACSVVAAVQRELAPAVKQKRAPSGFCVAQLGQFIWDPPSSCADRQYSPEEAFRHSRSPVCIGGGDPDYLYADPRPTFPRSGCLKMEDNDEMDGDETRRMIYNSFISKRDYHSERQKVSPQNQQSGIGVTGNRNPPIPKSRLCSGQKSDRSHPTHLIPVMFTNRALEIPGENIKKPPNPRYVPGRKWPASSDSPLSNNVYDQGIGNIWGRS